MGGHRLGGATARPAPWLARDDHRVSSNGLRAMGWDGMRFSGSAWLVRQAGREANEEKMRKGWGKDGEMMEK